MSLQQLFQNLDDIIRTPEDIALLNAKILDLAVQGNLVDQSSEDESAEELAARIWQKRHAMISAGEVDRQRDLDGVVESEYPFQVPGGWRFVRLGSLVSKLGAGSTPLGGKAVYVKDGVKFIRSQNVWNDGLRLDNVAFIPTDVNERMANTAVQARDVLLNITGASIGRSAVVPDDFDCANVSQHVAILRFVEPQVRQFMHLCITSPLVQDMISSVEVGISREGLSMSRLQHFVLPLPPLAEQHRIVAKVDELLAQTRALEANLRRAQEEIVVVNQAALHRLETAEDPASLHAAWHTISGAFDLLYDDPRPLAALRQTILHLAVSGKLVRQDDQDEPASELLKRLGTAKGQLAMTFEKDGPVEGTFAVPKNWQWCKWLDVSFAIADVDHKMPSEQPVGVPYVSPKDFTSDGKIDFANAKKITHESYTSLAEKIKPERGDIIFARYGTIGVTRLVDVEFDFLASYSCAIIKHMKGYIDPRYVYYYSQSDIVKSEIRRYINKTTQPNVGIRSIQQFLFPLPPLAEQRRIVAKVDELLGMCDALERQLDRSAAAQKAAVASVLAHLSQQR